MTLSDLPIFDQILSDGEIPPRQLQLWRALAKHLDVVRARKIPMDLVERTLSLDQSNIRKMVIALIERGYLVRETGLYRIPLSRENACVGHNEHQEADTDAGAQVVSLKRRTPRSRINSEGVV